MKRHLLALLTLAIAAAAFGKPTAAAPLDPERFEGRIKAYELATVKVPSPAPDTAIVFIGSSTFTNWKELAGDFPHLPVVNRAFGGSTYADLVRYGERLLVPLAPRLVVVYSGGNDLARGDSPAQVAANAAEFVKSVQARLPRTEFLILGSKVAPSRSQLRGEISELNSRLAAFCASQPRTRFFDISPLFLDPTGAPDSSLFIGDRLHLNREGYLILRDALAPQITR